MKPRVEQKARQCAVQQAIRLARHVVHASAVHVRVDHMRAWVRLPDDRRKPCDAVAHGIGGGGSCRKASHAVVADHRQARLCRQLRARTSRDLRKHDTEHGDAQLHSEGELVALHPAHALVKQRDELPEKGWMRVNSATSTTRPGIPEEQRVAFLLIALRSPDLGIVLVVDACILTHAQEHVLESRAAHPKPTNAQVGPVVLDAPQQSREAR
mmetsp:Transcript_8624/g.35141  ORF Transcript_8624/g.35141 Transcript_8624/m.35141 type:complete len:212 (-) Transcript_8624:2945-3580(-)